MENVLNPKFLVIVGILACMTATAAIQSHYQLSITRATALLCFGLSVPAYIGHRMTGNPWLRRVAIALLPTAIIMWLVNSDLSAYPIS